MVKFLLCLLAMIAVATAVPIITEGLMNYYRNSPTAAEEVTKNFHNTHKDIRAAFEAAPTKQRSSSFSSVAKRGVTSRVDPVPNSSEAVWFTDEGGYGSATYAFSAPGARDASVADFLVNIPTYRATNTSAQKYIQVDGNAGQLTTAQGSWIWFPDERNSFQVNCNFDASATFAAQQAAHAAGASIGQLVDASMYIDNGNSAQRRLVTVEARFTFGNMADFGRTKTLGVSAGAMPFWSLVDVSTNSTLAYGFDQPVVAARINFDGGVCPTAQVANVRGRYVYNGPNDKIVPLSALPANIFDAHPACYVNGQVSQGIRTTDLDNYDEAWCGAC